MRNARVFWVMTALTVALAGCSDSGGDTSVRTATRVDAVTRPEFPLELVGSGGVQGSQRKPVIVPLATGEFFAVWEDSRPGAQSDIYGAKLAAHDGKLEILQPGGFRISSDAADEGAPDVAVIGSDVLVVWERRGAAPAVIGVKLNLFGPPLVLGAPATLATQSSGPRVAARGTQFVVTYEENSASPTWIFAKVFPTGTPVALSSEGNPNVVSVNGDLACSETTCIAAWTQFPPNGSNQIVAAKVSTTAAVALQLPLGTAFTRGPTLAHGVVNGADRFLLSYLEGTSTAAAVKVLSLDGSGGSAPVASQVTASSDGSPAQVAFNGAEFVVAWSAGGDLSTRAFSYDGVATGQENGAVVGAGLQAAPSLAFAQGVGVLVFEEDLERLTVNPQRHLSGIRLSPTGVPLERRVPLLSPPISQRNADVAFDGTNYLVVWAEHSGSAGGPWSVVGRRVSPTGVPLDQAGVTLAPDLATEPEPSIAYCGGKYLVVWETSAVVKGRYVSPTGTPETYRAFGPSGVPANDPSVGCNGSGFLVVWVNEPATGVRQLQGSLATVTGSESLARRAHQRADGCGEPGGRVQRHRVSRRVDLVGAGAFQDRRHHGRSRAVRCVRQPGARCGTRFARAWQW